ncbi:MAG: hypothetical protein IKW50_01120 [Oscillospiraceae bacterium]|nr:hypothetical protein [Oscillospiraceae bacterium]
MNEMKMIPVVDLQLLAEGGAGDSGTAQGAGVTAGVAARQMTGAPAGGQEETAPAAGVQKDADLNGEFESLIRGKFKAQFDARMQDTIQKRLKGSKEAAQKFSEVTPILEQLGRKYGVDASDIMGLRNALEEDRTPVGADETGREAESRKKAERLHTLWKQQEEEARSFYPGLSVEQELKNPRFVKLITNNVDIRTAYEVMHRDEIIPAAMQYAAQAVEQNLSRKIAAGGLRPPENGTGSRAAATVRSDVSKLSKADIDEVIRRVANGERVSFG